METKAGVGYSESFDSETAGLEATKTAMTRAGISAADLVLLFGTGKHDQAKLLRSVRSVVGPRARIVGGGAAGAITNDRLGYEGSQVGVAVIASDVIEPRVFLQRGLDSDGELEVGRKLGAQLRAAADFERSPTVMMYESVKSTTPGGPLLNMGTPLLDGMNEVLGTWPPTVGLGLHGDLRWRPGPQFWDDQLETQSAVAFTLANAKMEATVISNLRPMSTYREVTAAEGPAVLGIDGRPALDVIEDMVGHDLRWEEYPLTVTLGVNSGDKYGDFHAEDYANYLCVAVDRERKALIMSDTYLRAGTPVQLMRRHFDFPEIRKRADGAVQSARGSKPFLALYIDCAGRARSYVGSDREEAAEIQAAVGADIPLLGIYVGSEIARVGNAVRRLNHAGVLALFSE